MNKKQKLYQAINAVTKDILDAGGIAKENKNSHMGYKYASIDDIYSLLAPLLVKNKLCIMPEYSESKVEEGKVILKGCLNIVSTDEESEGVGVAIQGVMYGNYRNEQSVGACMSYFYKYMCMQLFCIPFKDAPDSDRVSSECITREQASVLTGLAVKANISKEDFLKKYKVKSSLNILTKDYNKIKKELEALANENN